MLCAYSMDGQLEFYDTDSSDFTLMASSEHSMATDLEWDPTGRYVVTSVSYWSQKVRYVLYVSCLNSLSRGCAMITNGHRR